MTASFCYVILAHTDPAGLRRLVARIRALSPQAKILVRHEDPAPVSYTHLDVYKRQVQRIVLEMLAVTLSKDARARAVQLPAWNEALGLPRPWDQQWSLRLQQVLAFESDLLEYEDIFDGSPVIEAKVCLLYTSRCV